MCNNRKYLIEESQNKFGLTYAKYVWLHSIHFICLENLCVWIISIKSPGFPVEAFLHIVMSNGDRISMSFSRDGARFEDWY